MPRERTRARNPSLVQFGESQPIAASSSQLVQYGSTW